MKQTDVLSQDVSEVPAAADMKGRLSLTPTFMLALCFVYSLTPNLGITCSSEPMVDL
jgi:hypothetical protein